MARALYRTRATRPEHDESDVAEEMRALGASDADIEAFHAAEQARSTRDAIEVHEDNLETVLLFDALGSQWRFAGLQAVRIGLDYGAIEPTARMLGVEMTPVRFTEIRLMEQVACRELAKAASRGSAGGRPPRGRRRR